MGEIQPIPRVNYLTNSQLIYNSKSDPFRKQMAGIEWLWMACSKRLNGCESLVEQKMLGDKIAYRSHF